MGYRNKHFVKPDKKKWRANNSLTQLLILCIENGAHFKTFLLSVELHLFLHVRKLLSQYCTVETFIFMGESLKNLKWCQWIWIRSKALNTVTDLNTWQLYCFIDYIKEDVMHMTDSMSLAPLSIEKNCLQSYIVNHWVMLTVTSEKTPWRRLIVALNELIVHQGAAVEWRQSALSTFWVPSSGEVHLLQYST